MAKTNYTPEVGDCGLPFDARCALFVPSGPGCWKHMAEAYLAGQRGKDLDIAQYRSRLLAAEAERDEAKANYQFMVNRAADEKLDGYRALGARAAAAENEADRLRRSLAAAEQERDEAKARLGLARHALLRDGYFTPEQVDDDVAPRIIERLAAAEGEVERLRSEVERLRSEERKEQG